MSKRYKYANAHEWFVNWIDERPAEEILAIACELALKLDGDTLQDLFQSDMEADDYFQPIEEEPEGPEDYRDGGFRDPGIPEPGQ